MGIVQGDTPIISSSTDRYVMAPMRNFGGLGSNGLSLPIQLIKEHSYKGTLHNLHRRNCCQWAGGDWEKNLVHLPLISHSFVPTSPTFFPPSSSSFLHSLPIPCHLFPFNSSKFKKKKKHTLEKKKWSSDWFSMLTLQNFLTVKIPEKFSDPRRNHRVFSSACSLVISTLHYERCNKTVFCNKAPFTRSLCTVLSVWILLL